ncbi:hypothetical protein R3P38DRAFT_1156132 [Favolaschia claudopus]|uniref:Secreted protein n=1 Tax=Favolaschia claudopus TaxID=2862362 RepID=A0AAW0B921_9AGAR
MYNGGQLSLVFLRMVNVVCAQDTSSASWYIDVTTNLRRHDLGKLSGMEWLNREEPGWSDLGRVGLKERRERAG